MALGGLTSAHTLVEPDQHDIHDKHQRSRSKDAFKNADRIEFKKRLAQLNTALPAAALQVVLEAHARDLRATEPELVNSQDVSREARLLEPEEASQNFDGSYTRAHLKQRYAPRVVVATDTAHFADKPSSFRRGTNLP